MYWKNIGLSQFKAFHQKFQGDNPQIFNVCVECGGKCEYSKIATLLPGEAEYMASQMDLSLPLFRDKYLDQLQINDKRLDMIKLVDPCPFLSKDYECLCRPFKVILCEMYPIIFKVKSGQVYYFLDEWCPLAQNDRYQQYFKKDGIEALLNLNIPPDWCEVVSIYDDLYFDYKKLYIFRKEKGISEDVCAIFPLDMMLHYQISGEQVRKVF